MHRNKYFVLEDDFFAGAARHRVVHVPSLRCLPTMKVLLMSRGIATAFFLSGIGLALTGCGYSTGDRAASGGLLGAGAGAAVGGLTGGSVVGGALIGGAIGAVGGAVTSPNDVNLGRPAWR